MPSPVLSSSHPSGVTRSRLEIDAPSLAGLLDHSPSLLVYSRSSSEFESHCKIWNTAAATQPLVIVRPRSEDEVTGVVRFCASQTPPVPLSVRAGGHNAFGLCLVENGVVIDLRGLNDVISAEDRSSARIGGGVTSGQVAQTLESRGLFTPAGHCSTVGYAGWALGGGYGIFAGQYGLGCDQILAARVVTASGKVVDTKDDPDLLWALKGSGNGNFGVVVELTIKTYPKPALLGGFLGFPLTECDQVFAALHKLSVAGLLEGYSGDFWLVNAPGAGPRLILLCACADEAGDLTKAKAFYEDLTKIGTVVLNTVAETTPASFAAVIAAMDLGHVPRHLRTRTVAGFTPEVARVLLDVLPPPGAMAACHFSHGVSTRPSSAASFANRESHITMGISGTPGLQSAGSDIRESPVAKWVDEMATAFSERGLALEKAYMNFSPPEEFKTLVFYGKETTERLKGLKKKYDEKNLFSRAYPPLF